MPNLISGRKQSGFSLVEILLICGILASLVAILLPLLPEVNNVAYREQCVSNLRQFATAFSLYSNDWNGYWPCPGGRMGDENYWAQLNSNSLRKYIRQNGIKSVWCCPTIKNRAGIFSPRSYFMNSYLCTPADVEYGDCINVRCGLDICKLSHPAKSILLYEGSSLADDGSNKIDYASRCGNWEYVSGYKEHTKQAQASDHPAHRRFNNYLYCDGHIISRAPGIFTTVWNAENLSTYSEMYQWYVDKTAYERKFTRYWANLVPRN